LGISKAELLEKLKNAYELEEVMAGLLTELAGSHVLTSKIPLQDRQKVRRLLSIIHADTREHEKLVFRMIAGLQGGSFGV